MEKILIFDSGTLINFSMNGLLYTLEELKKTFKGKFIITQAVRHEVLDRPLKINRFKLEALRIRSLIENNILEFPSTLNISEEEIQKGTKEFMDIANHSVQAEGKYINIVSDAEISCLALSKILSEKGIENLIAIDERTTRILSEKPENLEKLMTKKLHHKASVEKRNLEKFKGFRFIRSSELAYVAYKKGVLRIKGKEALEAALYATRFKGSSISFEEIEEMKNL